MHWQPWAGKMQIVHISPLVHSLLTHNTLFDMFVNTSLQAFPAIQPMDKHVGPGNAILTYLIMSSPLYLGCPYLGQNYVMKTLFIVSYIPP